MTQTEYKPLEGIFDPEIIELARHCPILHAALTMYQLGDLSKEEAMTKIVLTQAQQLKSLRDENLRLHQVKPASIIIERQAKSEVV